MRLFGLLGMAALMLLAIFLAAHGSLAGAEGEHRYVGSKRCKTCHKKEWSSWSETAMAKTFDVLKPGARAEAKTQAGLDPAADYTRDASCLPCHTTGYGKAGGFTDLESTPDLAGVGCEMCHGAAGTYLEKPYMSFKNKEYKKADLVAVGMIGQVSAAQCTVCHNNQHPFASPDFVFDFETSKKSGLHANFPLKYKHE